MKNVNLNTLSGLLELMQNKVPQSPQMLEKIMQHVENNKTNQELLKNSVHLMLNYQDLENSEIQKVLKKFKETIQLPLESHFGFNLFEYILLDKKMDEEVKRRKLKFVSELAIQINPIKEKIMTLLMLSDSKTFSMAFEFGFPIHFLIDNNPIVHFLISKDSYIRDSNNFQAMITKFIELGWDINQKNQNKENILFPMTKIIFDPIQFSFLMQNGANPNLSNHLNILPLAYTNQISVQHTILKFMKNFEAPSMEVLKKTEKTIIKEQHMTPEREQLIINLNLLFENKSKSLVKIL